MRSFLRLRSQMTKKLRASGLLLLGVSITLLVWVVLLPVVALIYLLLMIPTRSRTSRPTAGWRLIPLGRGSKPGRYNV